jgi:outer membrane protein W
VIIATIQQFVVSAQDLLVTSDGDSVNCKITQIKGEYIYFTFKSQKEVRNTFLPVGQIKSYQYGFYNPSSVKSQKPQMTIDFKPKYTHWRVAANGGWSYRTAPIDKDVNSITKEYLKNLRTGLSIGLDASYFFNKMFGVGLKYDLFKTSNSFETPIGKAEDNISIHYVAPAFAMRLYSKSNANCWFMSAGIGYMGYIDEGKSPGQSVTIKGSTVGLSMDVGYDFAISNNWSAGVQLSLLSGVLYEMEETINGVTEKKELEEGNYEGLQRLNISIGIRYNF